MTTKKIVSTLVLIIFVLAALLAGFGCSSDQNGPGNSTDPVNEDKQTIAFLTPVSGLGDQGFADAAFEAAKSATEANGWNFVYMEPRSLAECELYLQEYAKSGDYPLIIAVGFDHHAGIQKYSAEYPDQVFLLHDAEVDAPNVINQVFEKGEMGFVAGAFAAMMQQEKEITIGGTTKPMINTNIVGSIIGQEAPSRTPAVTGFAAGALYMNPETEYINAQTGSFSDQAKAKELALSMYSQGAGTIFHNAGAGALGILEATKSEDRYFIGYSTNQNHLDREHVLASSMRAVDVIMMKDISGFIKEGKYEGGLRPAFGYSDGGLMFVYQEGLEVPSHIDAVIKDIQEKLTNKEIDVPQTWEDTEKYTDTYSGS